MTLKYFLLFGTWCLTKNRTIYIIHTREIIGLYPKNIFLCKLKQSACYRPHTWLIYVDNYFFHKLPISNCHNIKLFKINLIPHIHVIYISTWNVTSISIMENCHRDLLAIVWKQFLCHHEIIVKCNFPSINEHQYIKYLSITTCSYNSTNSNNNNIASVSSL